MTTGVERERRRIFGRRGEPKTGVGVAEKRIRLKRNRWAGLGPLSRGRLRRRAMAVCRYLRWTGR